MSNFLSVLNSPVVWRIYEKGLIVGLLIIAFGLVGLPLQLLALVPPLLRLESEEQQQGENDIEELRTTDVA